MQRTAKIAVSVFIIAVLGLQAVATVGRLHRFRYWPFLSYPMYNRPHFQGEAVDRFTLVGILADGRERPITPGDLKLDFWRYLRGPVHAVQKDDARGLLAQLQPFEHWSGLRLSAVRLENRPAALENGRVVDRPVELKTIELRRGR